MNAVAAVNGRSCADAAATEAAESTIMTKRASAGFLMGGFLSTCSTVAWRGNPRLFKIAHPREPRWAYFRIFEIFDPSTVRLYMRPCCPTTNPTIG